MAIREYLYRDSDGKLRWHDYPQGQKPSAAGGRDFGANGWSPGREDPDGTARFTSRKQRAGYLRYRGLCDRDAGYGDSAPKNY